MIRIFPHASHLLDNTKTFGDNADTADVETFAPTASSTTDLMIRGSTKVFALGRCFVLS